MFRSVFVIFAALFAVNATSPNAPIFFGENSLIQSYPYQISVETYGRFACGGAIISNWWVLTAAHCLVSNEYNMKIRSGSSFIEQDGTLHRVNRTYRLQGYKIRRDGKVIQDLAMVQLYDPIYYSETRQPIAMFEQGETIEQGMWGVVSGWGQTHYSYGYKGQLQSVAIQVYNKRICDGIYGTDPETGFPPDDICGTDVQGRSTCSGDSGGPLAINGRLAGLVSWGAQQSGCGKPGVYSGYVDIAYYRDIIRSTTGI